MENTIYSVTLSDGTIIGSLTKNGDNVISATEITESMFTGKCTPIKISYDDVVDIHPYMELVQVTQVNGAYWFVLRDLTQYEIDKAVMESNIDFIAMMTEVDL